MPSGWAYLSIVSNVIFQKTNVAHWNYLIRVYQLGWEKFGAIDAVISNAGVSSGEVHLQHDIDPTTNLLRAPPLDTLEINLIAHIYMTKCAGKKCQIVLTSSAATFLDTPPLYLYSTAKAGVLGLMRSLRTNLPKSNIATNTVAPWFTGKDTGALSLLGEIKIDTNRLMTATPMVPKALTDVWEKLPANTPAGIAIALLLPIIQPEINGKTFFVAGNEIVELEDTLARSQPQWMGEELSRNVDEGQRRLLGADPFE
ncbi:uncharacterized protein Z519_11772 [Cladophialophora bantiana CBS 173.52]|uniref:NAD(P)-binding protein n=1 Tax=Cladophialophora bantiana (strain ATCC 10958 / CBS 173.52 / CDC B-1940 / NIH 8579) TaxID=1442370 RepID=A0A0D2H399_CLAB1|nr:uncharacterized protein Z519_11772 [Cladophialophora bantiana CBS 173.52]KIW87798.1 hypothetical protein Z519_11772 [Cladophialophora bantiana CBS 173.52]